VQLVRLSGRRRRRHLQLTSDARLSASLSFYRNLLGIRSVKAVFENELHLEYDVPAPMLSKSKAGEKRAVTLVLHFDPATKRLTTAHVGLPSNIDSRCADDAISTVDGLGPGHRGGDVCSCCEQRCVGFDCRCVDAFTMTCCTSLISRIFIFTS